MRQGNPDVAIVGAGVVGLSCAWFLARAGLRVAIIERHVPGSGSSTRNGGGVRAQFATETNVRLSLLSAPYWASFQEKFGVDVRLRRIGYLFLAPDDAAMEQTRDQVVLQQRLGVPSELLKMDDIAGRWPSLSRLDVVGASFCSDDGFLNQHRVVWALVDGARATGVVFNLGTEVTAPVVRNGRIVALATTTGTISAGTYLNCAGAWAPDLDGADRLPIRGRRVQLMRVRLAESLPADLPWLIDPGQEVHLRQDVPGCAQIGGFIGRDETVDAHAFAHDADEDWIATVLERVGRAFGVQTQRSALVDSWAGLYPTTPDQHPIIDRTDAGMIVVGGFAGLGLMHAPAAGILARELVVDGAISSIDAAEVSLARFAKPTTDVEQTGF
jgi:sarcosine oxidase subunit beta